MITVTPITQAGDDLSVVNAARVSFDKESHREVHEITKTETVRYTPPLNSRDWDYGPRDVTVEKVERVWRLSERDQKLITYLAKHNHKSPFNHAWASFRVKAPVFVARQLVKHEYLPWNEVSRRYVDSAPEFYIPEQWRKRAEDKKQGSSDTEVVEGQMVKYGVAVSHCLKIYNEMLAAGVCPEQARMVLPQSMMTEWVWSGTLYAWAKMCKLRLSPHSQAETRAVAQAISDHMQGRFEHSWKALMEHINV